MNKIIIGIGLGALLLITGIVVYQFAEEQYAKQKLTQLMQDKTDGQGAQSAYDACLKDTYRTYDQCQVLKP